MNTEGWSWHNEKKMDYSQENGQDTRTNPLKLRLFQSTQVCTEISITLNYYKFSVWLCDSSVMNFTLQGK